MNDQSWLSGLGAMALGFLVGIGVIGTIVSAAWLLVAVLTPLVE